MREEPSTCPFSYLNCRDKASGLLLHDPGWRRTPFNSLKQILEVSRQYNDWDHMESKNIKQHQLGSFLSQGEFGQGHEVGHFTKEVSYSMEGDQ